jgi:hypothetical protein
VPLSRDLSYAVLELVLGNADSRSVWSSISNGIFPSGVAGGTFGALHSGYPGGASATQLTGEVSYSGYARKQFSRVVSGSAWTITEDAKGAIADTGSTVNFATAGAGSNTTANFFSLGTLISGAGKLLFWGPIASTYEVFLADPGTDQLTVSASGVFADNDRVCLLSLHETTNLPTGVSEGTIYYVVNASGASFQISATEGGGAVNMTSTGDGLIALVTPIPIVEGVTPSFPAGDIILQAR